jgi:hypothetical protein
MLQEQEYIRNIIMVNSEASLLIVYSLSHTSIKSEWLYVNLTFIVWKVFVVVILYNRMHLLSHNITSLSHVICIFFPYV